MRKHAPLIMNRDLHAWHGTKRRLWRVNKHDGYIQVMGHKGPVFTQWVPLQRLAQNVYEEYGEHIRNASGWFGIPEAIIVATICNESAGNRTAVRREPHLGDVSFGLGQLLTETASNLGRYLGWPSGVSELGPEWNMPMTTIPEGAAVGRWNKFLGNPAVNIALTTSYHYVKSNTWPEWQKDPILLYAAYNAGHAYHSDSNPWGLHATKAALSGFRNFYNDHIRNVNAD